MMQYQDIGLEYCIIAPKGIVKKTRTVTGEYCR